MTDVSMGVLGGDLKRKERLSARLGDILSGIYLASATLKRYDEEGRLQEDAPLMHWALQTTLFDIETAIIEFLDNFPSRPVALGLKAVIIPFGRRCERPSDRMEHKIANILQQPSAARSRRASPRTGRRRASSWRPPAC